MTYTHLFTQLVRTEIEVWNALDDHLRSVAGVTVPQFQALAAIAKFAGSSRVQDISGEMSITVGATSKLVDRLERDGFAIRQSNPDDRRSSIVVLTAAGQTSLAAAAVASESFLRGVFEGLHPKDRADQLAQELTSLRAALSNGITP